MNPGTFQLALLQVAQVELLLQRTIDVFFLCCQLRKKCILKFDPAGSPLTGVVPSPLNPMILYKLVLLIDDDKEDQEIFSDAIKEVDRSIQFISEVNSDRAISNLTGHGKRKPDIIFLDMNMPRMNGKQLLAELKREPSTESIPVVMCSTFFGDVDVKEITRLGAAHHLVKPTRFIDLCEAISKILSKTW
jgi:CheY-like chemotaxis protein